MCCGLVPILFGWFLRVPSLHTLVLIWKTFLWLVPAAFFFFRKSEDVGKEGEGKMHGL